MGLCNSEKVKVIGSNHITIVIGFSTKFNLVEFQIQAN